MTKSLYIHIPFCRKRCSYCDFYSLAYDKNLAAAYIEVLCRQIKALDGDFLSLYIGGGTPSVLSLVNLKKLLASLASISRNVSEFTIEVNPESIDENRLKLFLDRGVNRISIGVQSFFDKKLKKLGRIHSSKQAKHAIRLANKKGFKNVGIDLIFGVSDETLSDWMAELKQAVSLGISHISTYCLTYEKSTPLFLQVKKKFIIPLEDKILARMYKGAINYLSKNGFRHYEISNFAKRGFESQHNINYWQGSPYLGLGPSAVSFMGGTGKREKNVSGVIEYIDKLNKGQSPVASCESLSGLRRAKELAAIKIRTKSGIGFDWFKQSCGFDFAALEEQALKNLITSGFIRYRKRKGQNIGVYLTNKGFLFADTVSSAFV